MSYSIQAFVLTNFHDDKFFKNPHKNMLEKSVWHHWTACRVQLSVLPILQLVLPSKCKKSRCSHYSIQSYS